jgi:cytoskeleton protein RodZ
MNAESQSAAPQDDVQPVSERRPGRVLRDARIAANLAQGEVASRLNLTVTFVDALERDASAELPSPVFVRGYIKNYARLLGLATANLVDLYDAQRAPDEPLELRSRTPVKVTGRRGGLPRSLLLLMAVVVIGAITAWWLDAQDGVSPAALLGGLFPARTATPPEPAVLPPPVVETPLPDMGTVRGPESVGPDTGAAVTMSGPAPAGDGDVPDAAPSAPPVAAPATPPPVAVAPPPPPPSGDRLELQVNHDAWIEITDSAGERLVFDILASGTRREVRGVGPFVVLLGRAEAVDLKLNGQTVDHVVHHRKGIARFIVEEQGGEIVTRNP